MRPCYVPLLAVLAASLPVSSAQAGTVVQSISLLHDAGLGGVLRFGQGTAISQFDPSLGTLTSVTLSLDNQVYYGPSFATNHNPAEAGVTIGGLFSDLISLGPLQLSFVHGILETVTLPAFASRLVGVGGTASLSTTLTANFGTLIGPGTITPMSAMTAMITTLTIDPNVRYTPPESAQFYTHGTLTYSYQAPGAVPEPATWALMIAGFAMAGGAMRRMGRTAVRADRLGHFRDDRGTVIGSENGQMPLREHFGAE